LWGEGAMTRMHLAVLLLAIAAIGCAPEQQPVIYEDDTLPSDEGIVVTYSSEESTLSYSISITKPTPCHEVKAEENILDSFPPQVQVSISMSAPPAGRVCIQVIEETSIEGSIAIRTKPRSFSAFINGRLVGTITNIPRAT